MHAFDAAEINPEQARLQRERRVLAGVVALLLVTTALISPLAFNDLPLLLLLVTPFALALLLMVATAPLSVSAASARASREHAAAMQGVRRAAAAQHAILTPHRNTLPRDSTAALAEAVAVAQAHGIHFGSAHLGDEDFLQDFHAGDIRAGSFRHGDHLRYTALMLQRVPPGLVEETIAINLRAFLRQVCGSEALFHATRTHAWITVLRALPRTGFAQLLLHNAASLSGNGLGRYYSKDLLNSDAARERALAPDLEPLPPLQAPISSRTYPAIAPPTNGPNTGIHA